MRFSYLFRFERYYKDIFFVIKEGNDNRFNFSIPYFSRIIPYIDISQLKFIL